MKIVPILASIIALSLMAISCSEKKKSGKETDTESAWNIGIDTSQLTNRDNIMAAAKKLMELKTGEEEAKKKDPSFKGHYYEILKYRGIISKKASGLVDTMPGNERREWLQKFREIMP